MTESLADRLAGVLLGMAVGDALGLPRERLAPDRAARRFGGPPLGHAFLFGRGMVSDDTEHAALTAQAFLAAPHDALAFQRRLAWGLRWWLAALPAGLGKATLRACVRLWLGVPPARAGAVSAGNGPAMRAPILGACLAADASAREAYTRASTCLTHRHDEADDGALLIALAAARAVAADAASLSPVELWSELAAAARTDALASRMARLAPLLASGEPPTGAAAALGLAGGVTGYIAHTVPMALYCWLHAPSDPRAAVEAAIGLGGDTDTVAAVVGGLAGALCGESAWPREWLDGLWEWPRSVAWLRDVADRLARSVSGEATPGPAPLAWYLIPARNAIFLAVVLAHGFRRMLP
ncbi:MAG: ADP-ribosylglycohydrolase family protein [Armatimonadetes bacterium]|nr:ADP-ribosylglycohydrolase family protein [Armatimonadota bacterium]